MASHDPTPTETAREIRLPPLPAPMGDGVYMNRELSRLDFDARVLAMSEDERLPVLERVKFLAIFSSNLDEFFQVRVAGLKEQIEAKVDVISPDGLGAGEQLQLVHARVKDLVRRATTHYHKSLAPQLAEHGIRIVGLDAVTSEQAAVLRRTFEREIFPVLTPLAVDPAHPFPYISDLSLNLAVLLRDPNDRSLRFARVKVPSLFPRLTSVDDGRTFVPLEELIAAHLYMLFPGMEVASQSPFRVTRDADLELTAGGDDLREAVAKGLRRQQLSSPAVRLEVDERTADEVLALLRDELGLEARDTYFQPSPLDLADLGTLYDLPRPELKAEPWVPRTPRTLARTSDKAGAVRPGPIFDVLREGDVLVHHPYDSFAASVEEFLAQAADDPNVLAIKHTLYRTSGPQTSLFDALVRAAARGKQVVTLVELKARFDEQANIEWAQILERAGVHVVYGLVGLKTHAKVTLVVRQEGKHIRRYCHIGTGNYHPVTARNYEDVGLLTGSSEIGDDLTNLFNHLTGASRAPVFRKLLVAPQSLRDRITELIHREMNAPDGRIVIKVNNLSDPDIIDELYDASRAGVEIDLIVRGICCLRPGVPGLSERIRVRSILGSFLEHSRIFRFGHPDRAPAYLLGSADLMPRNLSQRVETLVPVEDPRLQRRLEEILHWNLQDDMHAWTLGPDGQWSAVATTQSISAQRRFRELAVQREAGTRD